ncbi:MAG: RNA polymerase sigma factor [Myxococcales bacterium]
MVGLSAVLDPVPQPPPGDSLLARSQAGDRFALEQLLSKNASRVYRWAVLLGLTGPDAEDAAQEILATAARRIAACEAEAALTSWLFQNHPADRRQRPAQRVVQADVQAQGRGGARRRLRVRDPGRHRDGELAVRRCFKTLRPLHAEVLLLGEVEGYTRPEIAQMLGVPEGTVASRLRLAKDAFKKRWDELASAGGGAA